MSGGRSRADAAPLQPRRRIRRTVEAQGLENDAPVDCHMTANNVTNALFRNHTSFIKDRVHEMGRGVRGELRGAVPLEGRGSSVPVHAQGRPPETFPPRRAAALKRLRRGRRGRALDGLARNALQDSHAARPVDAIAVGRGCRVGAADSRDDASFPRRGRGTGRHVRAVPRPGFAARHCQRPRESRPGGRRQSACACAGACPRRRGRGARLPGAARLTTRPHP